jgi:hypothetical protein
MGLIALLLAALAEGRVVALEEVDVEVRDAHVGIPTLRHELHRLERPGTRDPDRRVGLLERPGPAVDVAQLEVLAVVLERAGLRPGPHDQLVGLREARARLRGVDREGEVFGAAADHLSGDDAPARDAIEHGDLLGHARGRVVERQRVAHDGDLDPPRAHGEHGRDDVRRRHQAIRILVMLVHADAVEAERLGLGELIDVFVVVDLRFFGVEEVVGHPDPGRVVLLLEVGRKIPVRHRVEEEVLHGALLRDHRRKKRR